MKIQQELESIWSGWKLDRMLGEGSFGKVYRIERENFGHIYEAALKVITIPQSQAEVRSAINDGMDEFGITAYFQSIVEDIVEEFALMSQLKGNTNIVSYEDHAVVPHGDGIGWDIFIRMELLTPLFDYLRKYKLSIRDVICLGIDMCNALEVCQKYNIIHRDIKPENIFVSDLGKYKLGDFGIARQMEKTSFALSKKGTYSYMAPEVYKGEEYNSNVDIYSLGIVLYRFLNNNRTPFLPPYPEPLRSSDRERASVMRMGGTPIPKPCNAEGRLAEIVLKACSYDPKERYESAVEFRNALESVLYDEKEAKLIYPDGDVLDNEKQEYLSTTGKDHSNANVEDQNNITGTVHIYFDESEEKLALERRLAKEEALRKEEEERRRKAKETEAMKRAEEEEKLRQEEAERERRRVAEEERQRRLEEEEKRRRAEEEEIRRKAQEEEARRIEEEEKARRIEEEEKARKLAEEKEARRKAAEVKKQRRIEVKQKKQEEKARLKKEREEERKRKREKALQKKKEEAEKRNQLKDQEGPFSDNKHKKIAIVVLACLLCVGGYFGYTSYQKSLEREAPSVVNMTLEEAEKTAAGEDGKSLKVEVSKKEYSDDVEKDKIISQSVDAGTIMKKGDIIEVVLSKGALVAVPELKGKTQEEAEKQLQDSGLAYEVSESVYSNDVEKNHVISQNVSAGNTVEEHSTVTVVLSKGALVTVPNLVGKSEEKAKKKLEETGLSYKVSDSVYSDDVKKNHVISQDIAEGSTVEEHSTVSVVMSKGLEQVEVPDLSGKTVEEAKEALKKARLEYDDYMSDYQYSDGVDSGHIISQSLEAGDKVDKNSKVSCIISQGSKPKSSSSHSSSKKKKSSGGGSSKKKKKSEPHKSFNDLTY